MKTKIKVILRTDLPTKGEEKRIDLRVLCQGKYTSFSTPYHVKPANWDKTKGCVVGNLPDGKAINSYLSQKIADFSKYLWEREMSDDTQRITIQEIKEVLFNGGVTPNPNPDNIRLEELFDQYVDKLEVEDARSNTIRNVKSSKRTICGFAHKKYGQRICTDRIDLPFLQALKKHLKNDLKHKNATIAKRMENLRAAIRWAIYNGHEMQNPFEGGYNKLIPTGDINGTFLNSAEYKRFKSIRLPADTSPSLKLSRWLFIFSCETGLRYSDMQDLKWEHLKMEGKRVVSLTKVQIKTRGKVTVPISGMAHAVIQLCRSKKEDKYVFDRIAGQTINDNLKILAKMAGIDKRLTYHVSRHTFASALAEAGAGVVEIMHLLGDKKLDLARTYVNIDEQGLRNTMNKVWQKRATNAQSA